MRNVWLESKNIQLNISSNIKSGFDGVFDKGIKKDVKSEMISFMKWIEITYGVPITIWIEFKYKNDLLTRNKKELDLYFFGATLSIIHLFIMVQIYL